MTEWLIVTTLAVIYAGIFTSFSLATRHKRRVHVARYCCGCGEKLQPGHICRDEWESRVQEAPGEASAP